MLISSGDNVPVLRILTRRMPLVVPVVMVAEMVPFKPPVPVEGQPEYQLGEVIWRNRPIPLLSWPSQDGEASVPGANRKRVVVFHPLPGDPEERRFALLALQDPEPRVISRLDLQVDNNPENVDPLIAIFCLLDGQSVGIPNFDAWRDELARCPGSQDREG